MRTYTVLYAEDVPHYGIGQVKAASDHEAIAMAKSADFRTDDPDWNNTICKRIVHIEGPDGIIAEDVPLDDWFLQQCSRDFRRKLDAAETMFEALEAQEMAEFDSDAARRKGYFERALALREAALKNARGQQ
jgi:hypothetical protein